MGFAIEWIVIGCTDITGLSVSVGIVGVAERDYLIIALTSLLTTD